MSDAPAPPEGLDLLEAMVNAGSAPAILLMPRDGMRELLAYLRHLERCQRT